MKPLATLLALLLPVPCWANGWCEESNPKVARCLDDRVSAMDDRISSADVVANALLAECIRDFGVGTGKRYSIYLDRCALPVVLRARVNRAR